MKQLVFMIALSLTLVACSKPEAAQSTLNEKIESFSKVACIGGTVTRYDFDRTKVYVFDNGCNYADNAAGVTDKWGNTICTLGTIAGIVDCRGLRFSDNAKNPVVVYRK